MLSFQRLVVYQRAIKFLSYSIDVVSSLPRGNSNRADQLTRSADNIVEGVGRWSKADCARAYKVARGEAMECAASLDVMKLRGWSTTRCTIADFGCSKRSWRC